MISAPRFMRRRNITRALAVSATALFLVTTPVTAAMAQPTESTNNDAQSAEVCDPVASATTTTTTTSTTTPSSTTTTATAVPCAPAESEVSRATTPSATTTPAQKTPAATTPTVAPSSTTSADAPTSSARQQKAPVGEWAPTENPKSTIVAGQMRSDREEIPEPFTKADADKAETMEARISMSRLTAGCQVYWPSPYEVCGAIKDKYNSLGGPGSFLSFPYSAELTSPDGQGKFSKFINGPIYWSAAGGAHPVVNSILNRWGVHQYEMGWLGYPTTDEIVHTDGIGRRQEFQNGAIYVAFTNAIGSAIKNGPIRDKYNALGGHGGPLGYPSSDEISVTKNNGRYNNFVNGTITWSTPTGARVLYAAVRDRWFEFGREDGVMGFPKTDEQVAPDGIGHFVYFEDGTAIYWYPVVGAWRIPMAILVAFKRMGFESGKLGYPTAPSKATAAAGGVFQEFVKGALISRVNSNNTFDYKVLGSGEVS